MPRDDRIHPAVEIGDVLRIDGKPGSQLEAAAPRRVGEPLDLGPGRLGIDVVDGDGRHAAPVVDARVEQAREVVEREVRGGLHVPRRAEQDPRNCDRPELVVERGLGMRRHPRPGLRTEVLDDDLLHVTVLLAERLQREERVDSLLPRLADADEDPARERDPELTREPDRLEPAGGDLVRRGPVRPAARPEPPCRGLEHDPHRRRYRPERLELFAGHHARIEMRQEAGFLEDEAGAALEVPERRLAAERPELLAGDLVAKLGLVAEREQRLAAAGGGTGARDLEHLVLGHVRALAALRRASEGAVPADVAAQRRQRDEHLRRVGDDWRAAQAACLDQQLVKGRGEHFDRDARHSASIRRSPALAFVIDATPEEEEICDSCS
jgi:hypothetical protein